MTPAMKRLRDAREAKSKNRQRLAEIGLMADAALTEEIRSEQDALEGAIPDLERRERSATVAVDDRGVRSSARPAKARRQPGRRCRGPGASRASPQGAAVRLRLGGGRTAFGRWRGGSNSMRAVGHRRQPLPARNVGAAPRNPSDVTDTDTHHDAATVA